MKLVYILIIILLSLVSLSSAYDTSLYSNLTGDGVYTVYNMTLVEADYLSGDGSNITGVSSVTSNSSTFWSGLSSFNTSQFVSGLVLSINSSWFSSSFDTFFSLKSSDDLTQGSVNLYDNVSWNESLADSLYISQSSESVLNVNSSDYWDGFDSPSDILISDLDQSGEENLNVNNSDYWDGLNSPSDFSTITASGLITGNEFAGNINWSYNQNYPTACPAGTFVTTIGDTTTCTAPTAADVDPGSFPSGNYSFDTGTLYVDGTNHRVGVGTTSPTAKLQLDTTTSHFKVRYDNTYYSTLDWDTLNAHGQSLRLNGDSGKNVIFPNVATNVGINTITPTAKLHVVTSGTTIGQTIVNSGTGNGLFIDQNGNGIGLNIDSESTTNVGLNIQDIASDKAIAVASSDKICLDGDTCSHYITFNGTHTIMV